MQNWKRLLLLIVLFLAGLAALAFGVGLVFTDLIVDFWWHIELGLQ